MKKRTMVLLLACSICFGMLGCGKKEEEKVVPDKLKIEEEKEEYQVIGNESEDAYNVLITNNMGQDITGIAIKTSDKENYPANMLKTDEVFKNGDKAELFYVSESTDQNETANADEKALNIGYNIEITLADKTVYQLNTFDFDDIKEEVELCLEDDVAFVKYISKTDDAEVSTKELELSVKAQKAAQEQAAQEAAQEVTDAASNDSGYMESNNAQQAPVQSTEDCLGGVDVPAQDSEDCLGGVDVPAQDSEDCLGGVAIN